ncbi:hypothetical protein [Priestia megaterium]|uniref:hypothetical protein n=1 Tax=Priestia megaterium TaxID=1404 RepID=UPI0015D4F8DC|nr:hypothetical protein [Priestia megaterium]
MKLSENWVTGSIKKELENHTAEMNQYKAEGNEKMELYHKGIVKGLNLALEQISKTYSR